jgi:hypothetical protein
LGDRGHAHLGDLTEGHASVEIRRETFAAALLGYALLAAEPFEDDADRLLRRETALNG